MEVSKIYLSVDAKDFSGLSDWWSNLLQRKWDREPMPSCHEWDVGNGVLFQVLDNPAKSGTSTVTFHISDLRKHVDRLRQSGCEVPDPVKVEGFEDLWYCQFVDPEGNEVGLLEGR